MRNKPQSSEETDSSTRRRFLFRRLDDAPFLGKEADTEAGTRETCGFGDTMSHWPVTPNFVLAEDLGDCRQSAGSVLVDETLVHLGDYRHRATSGKRRRDINFVFSKEKRKLRNGCSLKSDWQCRSLVRLMKYEKTETVERWPISHQSAM